MNDKERDYYDVLGIPRDADQKTIKDAYHRLAMRWHPDRSKSPDAEERFKEIAKAYAILSDPNKRAQYDARGFEGVAHYNYDDLFRNVDLGSLFGDLGFGFGPGGDSIFERFFHQPRQRQNRGEDISIRLEVSLDRIARGGTESLEFNHPVTCPKCNGYGTGNGKPPPACSTCKGSGQKVVSSRRQQEAGSSIQFQQLISCPECKGRGVRMEDLCTECAGRGKVQQPQRIKLRIPAGIEDGMTLRVPHHGLPGPTPGSDPGHLYVTVFTIPDPRFQRRGADLWRSESIALEDAVLGCRLQVPTLDGSADVTIPPGVQPDEVLRLRGKGLPRYHGDGQGDLNLRLQVLIPTHLTGEERQLFESLRKMRKKGA